MIRGLFSVFFLERKPPRVYSESSFKDDSVFCFVERDSIGFYSEFLPRALNSKSPTLEAYSCFWIGDTIFLITYLESWLKEDSGYIPESVNYTQKCLCNEYVYCILYKYTIFEYKYTIIYRIFV